ncbi:MAG: formylglycine-generating enzyme family protein [Hyphomicrobiales bacterium]
MKKYYILTIILLCLAYSCKKDEDIYSKIITNTDKIKFKEYSVVQDSSIVVWATTIIDTSTCIKYGFIYGSSLESLSDTVYSTLIENRFGRIINTLKPSSNYYIRAFIKTKDKFYLSRGYKSLTTQETFLPPKMPKEIDIEMQYVKPGYSYFKNDEGKMLCDAEIQKHFYISTKEVSIRQYLVFLNSHDSIYINNICGQKRFINIYDELCPVEYKEGKFCFRQTGIASSEDAPIVCVSLYGAMAFASWLTDTTCYFYQIPSADQWIYASHGGAHSKGYKYSGSNDLYDVAWYKDNSDDKLHKTGLKQSNELGLYDMFGNAAEWCQYYGGTWFFEQLLGSSQLMYTIGKSYACENNTDSFHIKHARSIIYEDIYTGFRVVQNPKFTIIKSSKEQSSPRNKMLRTCRIYKQER